MVNVGTGQMPDRADKRVIRIDGAPIRQQQEIEQHFTVLWQTPQMDQLFTEGSSARRRYLDRIVAGFDPEHGSRVARYDYFRRERAKLLVSRFADAHWLASVERKMAESSVAIAAARLDALSQLQAAVERLHPAFPKATIWLNGEAEAGLQQPGMPALGVEERLAEMLGQTRQDDAQSGRASHGAHKTELMVLHTEKGVEVALGFHR